MNINESYCIVLDCFEEHKGNKLRLSRTIYETPIDAYNAGEEFKSKEINWKRSYVMDTQNMSHQGSKQRPL